MQNASGFNKLVETLVYLGILEVEGTDEDEGTSVVLGIVEDEGTVEDEGSLLVLGKIEEEGTNVAVVG